MKTHRLAVAGILLGAAFAARQASAQAPTEAPPPPPPPPPELAPSTQPAVPPPVLMPAPAVETKAEEPKEEPIPLAGYRGGGFYLKDEKDNFILYPSGRLQVDQYNYFGPGVDETTFKSTLAFKRAQVELAGEFFKNWSFRIEPVLGSNALDNASGKAAESFAAAPGAAPTATSGVYPSAQTARVVASLGNTFINYRADSLLNILVGQTQMPFSLEGQSGSKYLPFMEKSLPTRVMGHQVNNGLDMGLLFWGGTKDKLVTYGIGWANGAGVGRVNTDGRGDFVGRVYTRPLWTMKDVGALKDLQVGASLSYGSRNPRWTYYDYNSMTTTGGVAFWNPIYTNATIGRRVHVLPANTQIAAAAELRVPFSMFDLTSEFVYVDNGTREAVEGLQANDAALTGAGGQGTLGYGHMHGTGYYVQAGAWLFGPRDIPGLPGTFSMAHLDLKKKTTETPSALYALVKWEQVSLRYDGYSNSADTTTTGAAATRSNTANPAQGAYDGDIKVNALSIGLNYYLTKHLRLTGQWTTYMFPDSAPANWTGAPPDYATAAVCDAKACANRAAAPAQSLPSAGGTTPVSVLDARKDGHSLHELLFRAQVAF